MFWMFAIDDQGNAITHKGDSGGMSNAYKVEEGIFTGANKNFAEPEVGYCMQVGSMYSRSYSNQDWWTTTPVTEIVSRTEFDDKLEVIFKTKNSTYKWVNYG